MVDRWMGQSALDCKGYRLRCDVNAAPTEVCERVLEQLGLADLIPMVIVEGGRDDGGGFVTLRMRPQYVHQWAACLDTLNVASILQLDTVGSVQDLTREIVVCMLMCPVAYEFPSVDELLSAVRIRINTVLAARKTTLAFHTVEVNRPTDCWRYDEDRGFVILPGVSLIQSLIKATQPEVSGDLYSFSCYRASEYLILLGIAQELEHCNPALYAQLQTMWAEHPIKSGMFHDVFLREQGSMTQPLPPRFFVPGDRTWFRNPDEPSADASGFEGSWVMYLGNGFFNNFWKRDQPYTLIDKCLEIYHWRHGLFKDAQGEERIDEAKVEQLVQASRADSAEVSRIAAYMQRYREPRGVYTAAGGCMDTTREFARWVCPGTADLVLPTY
jgi:hypothetical protein